MQSDFEGRTEQEAIDKAVEELGLDRDEFDVEIIESSRKGLFKKGNVKIRVYYGSERTSLSEQDSNFDEPAGEVNGICDPDRTGRRGTGACFRADFCAESFENA